MDQSSQILPPTTSHPVKRTLLSLASFFGLVGLTWILFTGFASYGGSTDSWQMWTFMALTAVILVKGLVAGFRSAGGIIGVIIGIGAPYIVLKLLGGQGIFIENLTSAFNSFPFLFWYFLVSGLLGLLAALVISPFVSSPGLRSFLKSWGLTSYATLLLCVINMAYFF